jgi:hypothetical protein
MSSVDDVLNMAFGLPEEERANVAFELLRSLPPPPSAVETDTDLTELLRERLRRVEQGNYVAYEAHETLAHLDEALAQKRRGQ